jgi:hypothetical protein
MENIPLRNNYFFGSVIKGHSLKEGEVNTYCWWHNSKKNKKRLSLPYLITGITKDTTLWLMSMIKHKTSTRFFNQSFSSTINKQKAHFTFSFFLSLNLKGGTYKYIIRPSDPSKKNTIKKKAPIKGFNIFHWAYLLKYIFSRVQS